MEGMRGGSGSGGGITRLPGSDGDFTHRHLPRHHLPQLHPHTLLLYRRMCLCLHRVFGLLTTITTRTTTATTTATVVPLCHSRTTGPPACPAAAPSP